MATPNPNNNRIVPQRPHQPPGLNLEAIEHPIRSPIQPSSTHNGFAQNRFDPNQLPPLPPIRHTLPIPWRSRLPPYRVDQSQRIRQMNHFVRIILERWERAHSTCSEGGLGPGYASVDLLQADFHDMQTLSRLVEGRLHELGEKVEEARGSNSFGRNHHPTIPGTITMTPIPQQLLHRPGGDSHAPITGPLSSSHAFSNGGSGSGIGPSNSYGTGSPVNQFNATMLPMDTSRVGNTNTNNVENGVSGVNGNNDESASIFGDGYSNDSRSLMDISSDGQSDK